MYLFEIVYRWWNTNQRFEELTLLDINFTLDHNEFVWAKR